MDETKICSKCNNEYPKTPNNWSFRSDREGKIRGDICLRCRRSYGREYNGRNDPKNMSPQPHRVYVEPYKYGHKDDEDMVRQVLEHLGMKWNGKFWWKPGYRTEDGLWTVFNRVDYPIAETGSYVLTKEETLEIQRRRKEDPDFSYEDIQSEYNITKGKLEGALHRVFKPEPQFFYPNGRLRISKKGVPYRAHMTDEDKELIVQLYKRGETIEDIADEVKRSTPAIKYVLRAHDQL